MKPVGEPYARNGPVRFDEGVRVTPELYSINLDETSLRVGGNNGWMWVASTNSSVVYRIAGTRGRSVPVELLSGYRGVMVHDAWKPYDAIKPAEHQLDLLHTNRWLETAEVRHGIEPRTLLGGEKAKMVRRGRPPDELISFSDGYRSIASYAVSRKDCAAPH